MSTFQDTRWEFPTQFRLPDLHVLIRHMVDLISSVLLLNLAYFRVRNAVVTNGPGNSKMVFSISCLDFAEDVWFLVYVEVKYFGLAIFVNWSRCWRVTSNSSLVYSSVYMVVVVGTESACN